MALLAGSLAVLTGCASAPPPAPQISWSGKPPSTLAADEAACKTDSAGVDVNEAEGYSDPRYGATSAMAAALNRDAPLDNQHAAVRGAAFAACMTDKGWKSD